MKVYTVSEELSAIADAFSAAHQVALKRPEMRDKAEAAIKALTALYDDLANAEREEQDRETYLAYYGRSEW